MADTVGHDYEKCVSDFLNTPGRDLFVRFCNAKSLDDMKSPLITVAENLRPDTVLSIQINEMLYALQQTKQIDQLYLYDIDTKYKPLFKTTEDGVTVKTEAMAAYLDAAFNQPDPDFGKEAAPDFQEKYTSLLRALSEDGQRLFLRGEAAWLLVFLCVFAWKGYPGELDKNHLYEKMKEVRDIETPQHLLKKTWKALYTDFCSESWRSSHIAALKKSADETENGETLFMRAAWARLLSILKRNDTEENYQQFQFIKRRTDRCYGIDVEKAAEYFRLLRSLIDTRAGKATEIQYRQMLKSITFYGWYVFDAADIKRILFLMSACTFGNGAPSDQDLVGFARELHPKWAPLPWFDGRNSAVKLPMHIVPIENKGKEPINISVEGTVLRRSIPAGQTLYVLATNDDRVVRFLPRLWPDKDGIVYQNGDKIVRTENKKGTELPDGVYLEIVSAWDDGRSCGWLNINKDETIDRRIYRGQLGNRLKVVQVGSNMSCHGVLSEHGQYYETNQSVWKEDGPLLAVAFGKENHLAMTSERKIISHRNSQVIADNAAEFSVFDTSCFVLHPNGDVTANCESLPIVNLNITGAVRGGCAVANGYWLFTDNELSFVQKINGSWSVTRRINKQADEMTVAWNGSVWIRTTNGAYTAI